MSAPLPNEEFHMRDVSDIIVTVPSPAEGIDGGNQFPSETVAKEFY